MASHHPTKSTDHSNGFRCPQCGKCFQKRSVFKYHQDMHILENTFSGSEPKQKTPFQSGSNEAVIVNPSKNYDLFHSKYDKDLDILQSIFSSETPTDEKESAPPTDIYPVIQCKVCKLPFSNEQDLLNHSYIDCIRASSGNQDNKFPERTKAKTGVYIEPSTELQGHGDKRSRSRSPESERDSKKLKAPPVSDSVTEVLKSFTYKCNNCSGEFTNFKRLKMHQIDGCNKPMDVVDDGGNEKCTPEPVNDSPSVKDPKSLLQNKRCAGCALTFETIGDLEDHLRASKQPECWSKSFPDKDMTHNKNFPCGSCIERFTTLDNLFKHDKNCLGYICSKCVKKFDSEAALSEHEMSHGIWKCRHCPKSYPKKKPMMMHVKLEHPEQLGIAINTDEREVKCKLCRQIFHKPESLEIHMKEHKVPPTLPCEECDRIFTFKWELKLHLKETHGITAEYECISCGAKFRKMKGLRHHYRTECKGEIKVCYRCNNMTFEDPYLFKEHMDQHKEQWKARFKQIQFSCKRCQKVFGDHKTLQFHIYSCTGVPSKLPENIPSQKAIDGTTCPTCKVNFKDLFNLQLHIYSGRCTNRNDRNESVSGAEISNTRSVVPMTQRGNHSVPDNANSVGKSGERNQYISTQDNLGISNTLTHEEYGSVQNSMENPDWSSGQQNEYNSEQDIMEIYSHTGTQNKYGSLQDNLGLSDLISTHGSVHNSSENPQMSSGKQNEYDTVQDSTKIPNSRSETQQEHVPSTVRSEKSPLEQTSSSVVDSSKLVGTMVCRHCNKHFFSKKKFNSHVRFSFCDLSEDQIYKCSLCNQRCRTEKQLFTHMKKCPRMDANLDPEALQKKEDKRLRRKARQHQRTEKAAEENRICPYCGTVSGTQMAHEEHKRRHIEEPTIKCITCEKLFYTQQALENHELWHINPFNPNARKPKARSLKK